MGHLMLWTSRIISAACLVCTLWGYCRPLLWGWQNGFEYGLNVGIVRGTATLTFWTSTASALELPDARAGIGGLGFRRRHLVCVVYGQDSAGGADNGMGAPYGSRSSMVPILSSTVEISVWILIATSSIHPTLQFVAWYRRRRRTRRGFCHRCGYNLTANVSGTCPECGENIVRIAGSRARRDRGST